MCRYACLPVLSCTRYVLGMHLTLTRTQYPHQQRPRSPPRGYLLTLSVGKVGTRRLGVADRSRSRRGEFRQLDGFRQLRRVSSIARSLHPSRSLMGSTGNPDGISHMCMLFARRGCRGDPHMLSRSGAPLSRTPRVLKSSSPLRPRCPAAPPGCWVPPRPAAGPRPRL